MSEEQSNPEKDPLLGRVLDGRFTIQSVLGKGGMGVVYRAHQASLDRSVALKVMIISDADREAEFQRRFFLEAATVAKLKHPNTITVFDYGSTEVKDNFSPTRLFFIAMELLDGVTLAKLVTGQRALPPLRAVNIAMQICRSLREAHKAGVVHRDLKPGNVMIVKQDDTDEMEGDFVKVLDFGLAKVSARRDGSKPPEGMTKAGTFMGSPRYVAPEQVEGRVVDARADIYSFGCVMYRLLSGTVPFDGKSPVEIMLKHVNDPPPALSSQPAAAALPRTLLQLVMQCLQKDPNDRPHAMDEVLTRLKLARAELGGRASGIVVVSDERFSHPEGVAVSDPPMPIPEPLITRLDRKRVESLPPSGAMPPEAELPSNDPPPANADGADTAGTHTASLSARPITDGSINAGGWSLGDLSRERTGSVDDSTRPTKVFGQLTAAPRRVSRRGRAVAAGIVLGGVVLLAFVAWRTPLLDGWVDRAVALVEPQHAPPVERAPTGPFAKAARLRITTTPPGADVLEEKDGLPRLLGTTPLTVDWDVAAQPKTKVLMLRKEGYIPATARVQPPQAGEREPAWLDVAATLRLVKPLR